MSHVEMASHPVKSKEQFQGTMAFLLQMTLSPWPRAGDLNYTFTCSINVIWL